MTKKSKHMRILEIMVIDARALIVSGDIMIFGYIVRSVKVINRSVNSKQFNYGG